MLPTNQPVKPSLLQSSNINLHPEVSTRGSLQTMVTSNRGILIGVIFVLVAVIVSALSLIDFDSTNQYKGMIQRVEHQTELLQRQAP